MNVFSILDTSDNEEEVPRNAKQTKGADSKKPAGTSASTTAAKPAKAAAPAEKKPERIIPGLPKPKQVATPAAAPAQAPAAEEVAKDNNRGGKPRGKDTARRGEKKHGKEGDAERRPKREFERRSANPRGNGDAPARGGRGSYNTGSVEQEAQDAEKDPENAVAEATGDAPEAEVAEDAEAPVEAVVETVKTLSLEEFVRQRDEARSASKLLASQQAARSVPTDGLASALPSKSNRDEDNTTVARNKKDQRSTGKGAAVELAFKFETPNVAPPRPRRDENESGRGNGRRNDSRGESRGGKGGRGESRPDSRKAGASSVNISSTDFPALL